MKWRASGPVFETLPTWPWRNVCLDGAFAELKRASLVMRAQSYRRRLFFEFDRAKQVFLP
jgi:hypothetical protein